MADRLLIVDDDTDFTAFFATVAKSAGYAVLEINDPTRLEDALQSWFPSHVVVDMNMPTIDGLEALRMLARQDSAAKIVICSGGARDFLDSVNRLGGRLGLTMSGVLQKPLRPTILREFLVEIASENEPRGSSADAFDRTFFDEVCSTMGREWVVKGLKNLTAQIEAAFAEERLASAEPAQMAQRAHALASTGGMFGFVELASTCRKLEEACSLEGDCSEALHHAQSVSRAAGIHARDLIIHLEKHR